MIFLKWLCDFSKCELVVEYPSHIFLIGVFFCVRFSKRQRPENTLKTMAQSTQPRVGHRLFCPREIIRPEQKFWPGLAILLLMHSSLQIKKVTTATKRKAHYAAVLLYQGENTNRIHCLRD